MNYNQQTISKYRLIQELKQYPVRVKYLYQLSRPEVLDILIRLQDDEKNKIPIEETIEKLSVYYQIELISPNPISYTFEKQSLEPVEKVF